MKTLEEAIKLAKKVEQEMPDEFGLWVAKGIFLFQEHLDSLEPKPAPLEELKSRPMPDGWDGSHDAMWNKINEIIRLYNKEHTK